MNPDSHPLRAAGAASGADAAVVPAQPVVRPSSAQRQGAGLRAIEQQARHMLAAARVSDWKLFWQLEMQCGVLVQELQALPHAGPQGASARPGWPAERQASLLRILDLDAQIRELLAPLANGRGQGTADLLH